MLILMLRLPTCWMSRKLPWTTCIGRSLPRCQATKGLAPSVAKGKAAIHNMMGRIRRDLCPRLAEPRYRQLIDSGTSSDAISLVAVLASLLTSLGLALNSTLVAILLLRIGLRTVCPTQP